ncbi:MAG: helix-turn-helix domain-containing protein, partial [Psychrobacillus sp.]
MAEQYNRRFEGIWIPANIWLSETLTLQEKIFLVEIKSLDNEQGCFASNEHFSKLFQLSKSRCSEVINKLKEKNLIRIQFTYKEGSKQIERRTIRVNY